MLLKTKITFYFNLYNQLHEDVTKKYAFKLTFIFMMYLS